MKEMRKEKKGLAIYGKIDTERLTKVIYSREAKEEQ